MENKTTFVDNRGIRDFGYIGNFYVDLSIKNYPNVDSPEQRRYNNIFGYKNTNIDINQFYTKAQAVSTTLKIINRDKEDAEQAIERYKHKIQLIDSAIETFIKNEPELYQEALKIDNN